MDKSKIANNFSRCAHLYDKYADIQNKAAFELTGYLKNNNFSRILELGCGTGNYTSLLRRNFSGASIKAVDISEEMVSVAQNKLKNKDIEFIIADAENLTPDKDLDLVTSNACFQWFNDLKKTLPGYAALLPRGGVLCFSIFGPRTFYELNAVLETVSEKNRIDSAFFCDRDGLKAMLKDNFKSVRINEVCYQEILMSLKHLLEKIKYSGVRGNGLDKRAYFSRGLLEKLQKTYLDKFQQIRVTYQVFFCYGEK